MKKLLIVLVLVLSACSSSAAPAGPAFVPGKQDFNSGAAPGTVYAKNFIKVVKYTWEHDGIGDAVISGQVQNTSDQYTLVFVELRGTVYDKNAKIVNTHTSYTDSDKLAPGASSTFKIYIDDPANAGQKAGVTVEDARFQ